MAESHGIEFKCLYYSNLP